MIQDSASDSLSARAVVLKYNTFKGFILTARCKQAEWVLGKKKSDFLYIDCSIPRKFMSLFWFWRKINLKPYNWSDSNVTLGMSWFYSTLSEVLKQSRPWMIDTNFVQKMISLSLFWFQNYFLVFLDKLATEYPPFTTVLTLSLPLGMSWFYSTLSEVLKRSRPWLTPIHVPIWRPLSFPMQNWKLRPRPSFETKSPEKCQKMPKSTNIVASSILMLSPQPSS